MQHKKIVFLASDCESSRWVYNAIIENFIVEAAIIEQPISKKILIKGRLKKIGFLKTAGQVMFSALVVPFLKMLGKQRKTELEKKYGLNNSPFNNQVLRVNSVNDETCKQALQQLQPDIVIVNGTRIITKDILLCTNAVFINMHLGITPLYRGSHGGYWACRNNDLENFGTTIHLVDAGVDTGAVLKQVFIKPAKQDNFATFPILQLAIGIEALKDVLQHVIKDEYATKKHTEKGKMYYQPAVWEYFFR
jgi:methionyl-tRNA formyltransferase